MKTVSDLPEVERHILKELPLRIRKLFPDWTIYLTLFGSRARGDADSDSDMDILLEVERDRVTFPEKQAIRRATGEFSIETNVIISLLIVDRYTLRERGDFSLFQNIRDERNPA